MQHTRIGIGDVARASVERLLATSSDESERPSGLVLTASRAPTRKPPTES